MATTAVASAVKWLGDMLVEEAKYLHGVEEKVEQLQDELEWMQCFLRDIDARRDRDARMHKWIRQITSLAYEAEDIIESFILKVDLHRHGGLLSKLKRYLCIMREAKSVHEVGLDIDDLKLKISMLTSRLHTYGIKITEEGNVSEARREQQVRKSYANYLQDGKNIVGLDNDVKVVVNELLKDKTGESRTVALCGMGGLGKTTLAKKVYHHANIKKNFHAFAWACVSQQCQVNSVLAELYRGLTSSEVYKDMTEASLMEKLHEVQQQKKCLVVLDDIWKDVAWDLLKKAFPVGQENSLGGKLLLTSRIDSVARYVDNKAFIHKQDTMDDEKAWLLLKKKLGRDPSNIFGDVHGDEMVKLAKEMLGHCGGLPMAIVALGGVLATKKSLGEWRIIHKNIKKALLLSGAKDGGLSCKQVLELSYHDLPMYLKPCFLYLAIFPEDAEIEAKRLISLWIAEGFIVTTICQDDYYDDDMELLQERSLEEVGRRYLAELADRSLVQIASIGTSTGKIKTCRVHDLVRELCLSKASKENFLKVVVGGRRHSSTSSTIMMPSPSAMTSTKGTYRRLAIHGQIDHLCWDKIKYVSCSSSNYRRSKGGPHVKSVLLPTREIGLSNSVIIMRNIFKEFRFIRVLDLVNVRMEALPKGVGDLIYLRYLSIKDSSIWIVPSSIRNLLFLQTLDLRSYIVPIRIPRVIWGMKQLKRLYLPEFYSMSGEWITGFELRCKVHRVGLNNLEILHGLSQLYMLKYIPQLSHLRELTVFVMLDKQGLKHIMKIQSALHGHLEVLSINLDWDVFVEQVDALRDLPSELKLRVYDMHLPLPNGLVWSHHKFPYNLTNLYLFKAKFEDVDPMQILGNLPKLRKLEFHFCSVTKNVTCSRGGFPEMTSLQLEKTYGLEEWIIEEGAMQSLRSLTIRSCDDLKIIPDGIKHIHNLQYLCIEGMGRPFSDRVRVRRRMEEGVQVDEDRDGQARPEEGADVHKVQHIPCIILRDEIES